MPDDTRDPNDLARSDLFHQDESAARRLWERGFRPVHAEDLEPGELVVFRETDPLAGQPYGEPLVGMVERVERDELGGVRVQHSSGIVTEADDWSEVWAKRLPGEKPRMTETTETCPEDGEQPVVDGGPEGGPLLACGHEVERRGEAVVILGMVIDGAPYGRAEAAAERGPSEREPNLPRPRFPEVVVPLIGEDSNALAILGRVRVALRRAGVDRDKIDRFTAEATAGDYDELLATVQRWVEVE